MGTGGNIPNKIIQTVTLFNTTGVIEGGKGIYFCPLMKKVTGKPSKVNEYWIDRLKTEVSGVDSSYADIPIATWSPEDRTLVIKGNIDDFRCVTTTGKCLNYVILTRDVYSDATHYERHYYGFFIINATQAGGASVSITTQPDDFSNVFYLFNSDELSAIVYYDPFNRKMCNFYIERQHYDRVYLANETYTDSVDFDQMTESYDGLLSEYTAHPEECWIKSITSDEETFGVDEIVRESDGDVSFTVHSDVHSANITINVVRIHEANLEIFSNIEETFKYRRQFRDYKEPLGEYFTEEEIERFQTYEWNDFSSVQKIKILKICCAFLTVVTKDNKCFLGYGISVAGSPNLSVKRGKIFVPKTDKVEEKLFKITVPIAIIPSYLSRFRDEINDIFENHITMTYYDSTSQSWKGIYGKVSGRRLTNAEQMAGYYVTAYITKDSSLFDLLTFYDSRIQINVLNPSIVETNSTTPRIAVYCGFSDEVDYSSGDITLITNKSVTYILDSDENIVVKPRVEWQTHHDTDAWKLADKINNNHDVFVGFMYNPEKMESTLDLSNKLNYDTVEFRYYEPTLHFEPYSFYSVSFLGQIEVPLSRKNYYQNPIISYEKIVNVSDSVKYTWIPTYEVNGKKFKYYTESLTTTLTNQLTIISDKLIDYVIANQSQMKNQFAVNAVEGVTGAVGNLLGGAGQAVRSELVGSAEHTPQYKETPYGSGSEVTLTKIGEKSNAYAYAVPSAFGTISSMVSMAGGMINTALTQKAKKADLGNMPSNLKQAGSDINTEILIEEMGLYLNHYSIDALSYNSVANYLERFGYQVNIFNEVLNVNNRAGYNYVKLSSFEFKNVNINDSQENNIRQIFSNGVTLLHDSSYLHTDKRNIETILKEVN